MVISYNSITPYPAGKLTVTLAAALLLILFSAYPPVSFAQIVQPSEEALVQLDHRIQKILKEDNTPGAQVALFKDGQIIHLQSYGLANVELGVPVSDSTVFEIGSISKQFVAVAALLLMENGKLHIEDPVHTYLPYIPSEWMDVTIRQLLTHTSGIPDYEEIRSYDIYRFRTTPEDVIKIAHSRPMDFSPGNGWYYSNTGYYLLSMILEKADGKPLGEILTDRIFEPLGMSKTRFADPESIIMNRAEGYWVNKVGDLINRHPTETTSTLGAGGLLTSAKDMFIWDNALNGDNLLNAESKSLMWTPDSVAAEYGREYGFGWRLSDISGMKAQSHTGQVAGFSAHYIRFPEEQLSIIFFFNRYRGNSSWKIGRHTLHTFMPEIIPMPE